MNFNEPQDEASTASGSPCYANFNQDYSCLVVGRKSDYTIFTLSCINSALPATHKSEAEDVILVERLFSTSLIALVTASHPSKLVLHHFKKHKEVCSYKYASNILAIKLNKMRLVVCLEDSICIHNIIDMRVLHTIKDIPLKTYHSLTLSPSSSHPYLAYAGSNQTGEVLVFDTENLCAFWTLEAHDSLLSTMTISQDGLLLATASVKGTVIRVFSIVDKTKIYEFRRGVKRCATVYSLAFSKDSTFLCCSSNTETVHIFRLKEPGVAEGSWMDYLVKTSSNYLPSQVTEMLGQERFFAAARLPLAGSRNICGITSVGGAVYLMVILNNGTVVVYSVDPVNGGECLLVCEHSLVGAPGAVYLPPASSSPSSLPPLRSQGPSTSSSSSSSTLSSSTQQTSGATCISPTLDQDWTKVKKSPEANTSPQWSPLCRKSYASVVSCPKRTSDGESQSPPSFGARSGPQQLKLEGEMMMEDAVVSIEDLYLDAECKWLEDSTEFPRVASRN